MSAAGRVELWEAAAGAEERVKAADGLFDHPVELEAARRFLLNESNHLVIAYVDDQPAGFVSGTELMHPDMPQPELFLNELGVDSAYRGRGIGRRLVAGLVGELDGLRCTGRRGYGARALVGACLTKALYAIPTWTRTARLIAEHRALAEAIGGTPSEWACYRFTVKLRQHSNKLAACLDSVTASLSETLPEMGRDLAIDSSDLPAYANGQRYLSKNGPERERFSDPDAAGVIAPPCPRGRVALLRLQAPRRRLRRDNPLVPRETKQWRDLYRGRAAVEREFGRLKHEYGLAPLRVRGLDRVQLHADLVMLAQLSQALARARAVPLGA